MSGLELKDCPDLTALTAQANDLKEKVDHLATLTGQSGSTGQSDDPGALTALTAEFAALKTALTTLASPPGAEENWAAPDWVVWAASEDRGNCQLSAASARAWLSEQPVKAQLTELTATSCLCLQKLRQLEHSLHFLEGRSELGFGLWHELCRVWHRCQTAYLDSRSAADLEGMATARADWRMSRRDYCVSMMRGGWLVGGCFSAYLLTWRFQA